MGMEYVTRIKIRIEVQTNKRGEVLNTEVDTLDELTDIVEAFIRNFKN